MIRRISELHRAELRCHECIWQYEAEELALAPEWRRVYPTNYLDGKTEKDWKALARALDDRLNGSMTLGPQ